jgi:phosphoenolpyruvate synthase/pyruvate phosphate dikinase
MGATKHFSEIGINDIPLVGGKNASLGEMYSALSEKGILVPAGFAVTSDGYHSFLNENNLVKPLTEILSKLNTNTFDNLAETGLAARTLLLRATLPQHLQAEILAPQQAGESMRPRKIICSKEQRYGRRPAIGQFCRTARNVSQRKRRRKFAARLLALLRLSLYRPRH